MYDPTEDGGLTASGMSIADVGRIGTLVRREALLINDGAFQFVGGLDVVDSRLLRCALSGSPSHLLLTFGTCAGSFCVEPLAMPRVVVVAPFSLAFSFSDSANCFHAVVEGSFNLSRPNMPTPFSFITRSLCLLGGTAPMLPADLGGRGPVSMAGRLVISSSCGGVAARCEECDEAVTEPPSSPLDEEVASRTAKPLSGLLFLTASFGTRTGVPLVSLIAPAVTDILSLRSASTVAIAQRSVREGDRNLERWTSTLRCSQDEVAFQL